MILKSYLPSNPMNNAPFVPAFGQKIYFGRNHGEKTLGEVVKVNRTTAKVKQLESRGTMRSYAVGTIWTVPFSLCSAAPSDAAPAPSDDASALQAEVDRLRRENEALKRNQAQREVAAQFPATKRADAAILNDINRVYSALSPENLTCDGELRGRAVQAKAFRLRGELKNLFRELGRTVSEDEAWESSRAGRVSYV